MTLALRVDRMLAEAHSSGLDESLASIATLARSHGLRLQLVPEPDDDREDDPEEEPAAESPPPPERAAALGRVLDARALNACRRVATAFRHLEIGPRKTHHVRLAETAIERIRTERR